MQVSRLLDRVESNAIVLPEFQREFVWKESQAKGLVNSLFHEYPIGSLLTWETERPPEIKNDAIDRERHGLFEVLLDGQQRLTVLYMLVKNDIPPYYDPQDIENDPRNLYFNVSNGSFQFENRVVKQSTEWVSVTKVFLDKVKAISVAQKSKDVDSDRDIVETAELYEENLSKLKNIQNLPIPVETLPKSAGVHQAIELFDRVNSQGTHLTDPELALAHMSAEWPYIRREMKFEQERLADKGFDFDLNFYVKVMIGALTETMTYKNVYNIAEQKLRKKWGRLAGEGGMLDYATNILKNEAHIPSSEYLSTSVVLIPFVVFADKRDKIISSEEKRGFLRWMYAAMMWSRYGGSSDTTVEHDLSLLNTEAPTERLMQEVRDDRGRIEVQPTDLEGRGKRSRRFYNMVHIVTRAHEPVDWKTGEPLVGSYDLESHHIFPKSKLYEIYDSSKSEDRKLVNEIANRAFVTPETNRNVLLDRTPEDYLEEVVSEHPSALQSQFIPEKKELWKIENYEEFLKKRRSLLADVINDYMKDLKFERKEDGREKVSDLISQGENVRIEFKETFVYDVYQDQPNKDLKASVVKEIASLANAKGGVVIIGVEDDSKEVKGLDRDFNITRGKDGFELQLNREIKNRLGHLMATAFTEVSFEAIDSKDVCTIWVDESPDPVYFSDGNHEKFYVRNGSSAEPLTMQEAQEYVEIHF